MPLTLTVGTPSIRYAAADTNKGVGPLLVQVTHSSLYAEDSDGNVIANPSHIVHTAWDFFDPTSGERFTDPITNSFVNSATGQTGNQAAHVYRTPGVYKVRATCYFFDPVSLSWITATADSATFEVTNAETLGWEAAYFDPERDDSLQTGSLDEPFVTYDQCQNWLNQKDKRVLYLATGSVIQPLSNERQQVSLGSPSSGNFTISWNGETTATIPYNATAARVENALRGLAAVFTGDIKVTGANGGPYTLEFRGQYAGQNVAQVTADGSGLTGGTVAVSTTQAGGVPQDVPVFSIKQLNGLRIMRYTPPNSLKAANPILRLASSASGKAVVSVEGIADNDATNEVQRVTLYGATAGNFILSWEGETTGSIPYNASASTVKTAITSAISGLTGSDIDVTGSAGGPYTLTFQGAQASKNVPLFSAASVDLTGNNPVVEVEVVTPGSVAHTSTTDVFIDAVDLDGNGTTNSRGIEVLSSGTTRGFCADVYFSGGRITNVKNEALFIEDQMNSAGSQGPRAIGLVRASLDATTSTAGHLVRLACLSHALVMGCSFRGGNGNETNDHYIAIAEFDAAGTPRVQSNALIRWNGFQPAAKRNFCVHIGGSVSGVTINGNNITGTRNGIYLSRVSSAMAIPENIYVEGNRLNNLGLVSYSLARGIHMRIVRNVSIRNNLFYENGLANGAATTEGEDIYIEQAGVVSGLNDAPIRLEHNSHYRSYERAGSPLVTVDDDRWIQHYNNAYDYRGGVGSGSDAGRAIMRFTSSAYAVPPRNERQRVEMTGNPTGGSFRLSFTGNAGTPIPAQTTGNIFQNASAEDLKAALVALAAIGPDDVDVTGPISGPWIVTFKGVYANTNIAQMTVHTNALTGGTSPTVSVTTLVAGQAGLFYSDGNRYYAPNLLFNNRIKPFVVNGSSQIVFDAEEQVTDWRNAGNVNALDVWDVNGAIINPAFRNPKSGNFRFNAFDPLTDAATLTPRGVRFDVFRNHRGNAAPDAGAFESTGDSDLPDYVYQPSAQTNLPVAGGENYRDGDIRHIDMLEPVRVTNDTSDVDNRPHRHLAHRDNLLSDSLDGLLGDVNIAFCSPPQTGSAFTAPHTSIASFIFTAHNPDGTIRPEGLDLSSLPFLRTDGGNFMLANLDFGTYRGVNVSPGETDTDVMQYGQGVKRAGDSMFGTLTMSNSAGINMGGSRITLLGNGTTDTDAITFGQAVKRAGDTISGTIIFNGIASQVLDLGSHRIVKLAAGTAADDAVRRDQVLLITGGTMTGPINMAGQSIAMNGGGITGLAAGVNAADAVRRDQVLLLSGGTMTGVINMNGQNITLGNGRITGSGAAVADTDVPQYAQCLRVSVDDVKRSRLTMGPHNWVNGGVLSTNGHAGYVAHTSVPTGGSSGFSADGQVIDMNAVPYLIAFPPNATSPYFDGQYIRNGPSAPVSPNAIANVNEITQATGNAITNLALPTLGHDAANKKYVDLGDEALQAQIDNLAISNFTKTFAASSSQQGADYPFTQTGVANGTWLVHVYGVLAYSGSNSPITASVTANGGAANVVRSLYIFDQADGNAPFSWPLVVQVTNTTLGITAGSNVHVQGMVAIKIG